MKRVFNVFVIAGLVAGLTALNGCKEKEEIPTVTTTAVTAVTTTGASTGGDVTSDGGAEVTARGVCYGTTANPDITGPHTTDASGTGPFTSTLTGLTPGTTYHVRAYATNSEGTAYGNDVTFPTTAIVGATVTTTAVTDITSGTAVSGGNVTADGGDAVTEKGICWGPDPDPDQTDNVIPGGAGLGAFTSNITGLEPGHTYHVRAYAENSAGVTYGADVEFSTPGAIATVTTAAVTNNTTGTSVTAGGNVTADGGATVTVRGICWSTAPMPDLNDNVVNATAGGTGAFTVQITDLDPYTTYYVRAFATNTAGDTFGDQVTFLTPLADIDGNIYTAVTIGTQVWMGENLRVTHFNDGTQIPYVPEENDWINSAIAGYCYFDNDSVTNKPKYGALYNWYAAGADNLCPSGWHVPADADFMELEATLGMDESLLDDINFRGTDQGAQMKSITGWLNNGIGSNASGFNAVPAGLRYYQEGTYLHEGTRTYFWSSDDANPERAYYRQLNATIDSDPANDPEDRIGRNEAVKTAGKSVRCVKDN
ncbi:MAG: fibrobacter succinogenes major paralogous domain-containing protein [Bacteroidales bacterium]|jgi:uncharacterized protein (TIGR02145 family)|nr:fibrobacter succinogenes major paralogous domain-containing protein [Bacteroidales bacterium]